MQNRDEASPSIILAGRALLMKMLITLEPCGIFFQILYTIVFQHCPTAGMRNGNEASPSIILAVQALLVKMLKKTLDRHGIF